MIRSFRRAGVAPLSVLASAALVVTSLSALAPTAAADDAPPPPITDRTSSMFTTDPLPTAQINGVVYTQVAAGNTVFAAGDFSKARPAGAAKGTKEVSRKNIVAFKASTGKMTSFAPKFNGTVYSLALSKSKKTLFVGGNFTTVTVGKTTTKRSYFAALSTSTGKPRSVNLKLNNLVRSIYVDDQTMYLGGFFTTVNGNARKHIAAATTSGRLTSWAPGVDGTPMAMVLTPDRSKLVVGGNFTALNGTRAIGMGALDRKTGATRQWKINEAIEDGGPGSAIDSLRTDGTNIYGSGYSYNGGNFEGTFAASPADGSPVWVQDCHGDSYDVLPVRGVLYSVSHAHSCKNIGGFPDTRKTSLRYRALAVTIKPEGTVQHNTATDKAYGDFGGLPAPSLYNWFPDLTAGTKTGLEQAAWSLAATSDYLILGGEFTAVNGKAQQGLVRLATPKKVRPRVAPVTPEGPTITKVTDTSATVTWPSTYDQDNLKLSYELLRDGKVVSTQTNSSPRWAPRDLSFTDSTLQAGTRYTYAVRVKDPDGNTRTSAPTSYPSPYLDQVKADGPEHLWRMDARSGKTDQDRTGQAPLTFDPSHVDLGVAGAIKGDVNPAIAFDGDSSSAGGARTTLTQSLGTTSSLEGWFTTKDGDADLIRFRAENGGSDTPRRLSLVGGQLVYTVTNSIGEKKVVSSPGSYADGSWHHVVATQQDDRISIYVDGTLVTSITGAPAVSRSGRYAVGVGLKGTLDEVATYTSALSADQVARHYALGRG